MSNDFIDACNVCAKNPQQPSFSGKVLSFIPKRDLPRFLVKVAELAWPPITGVQEYCALVDSLNNESSWAEAETIFHQLRALNLESKDSRESCALAIAERGAKLLFNFTNPQAPFDATAGHGFIGNLVELLSIDKREECFADILSLAYQSINVGPNSG